MVVSTDYDILDALTVPGIRSGRMIDGRYSFEISAYVLEILTHCVSRAEA